MARATYRTFVDATSGEVLYREKISARAARHRDRVFVAWGLEALHFSVADRNGEFDEDEADDFGGGAGGCSVTERRGNAWLLALLGLFLWARRRQR